MDTHRESGIVVVIFKDSVQIPEKPMFRSVIAAITKVQASYKCGYLPIVSSCLCIHNHTFLVMSKESPDNLKFTTKTLVIKIISDMFLFEIRCLSYVFCT